MLDIMQFYLDLAVGACLSSPAKCDYSLVIWWLSFFSLAQTLLDKNILPYIAHICAAEHKPEIYGSYKGNPESKDRLVIKK